MDLKSFIGDDYLKGKPVYPAIRRALSFLFSVSITSFIFEHLFFKYTLIDISDYKGIYDFLIKGFFFVPFSVYVIVHFVLDIISRLCYDILISIKADKYRQKILRTKYKKSEAKKIVKALNDQNQVPFIIDIPWLFAIYQHFTSTFNEEHWNRFLADLEKNKRSIEHNFRLLLKGLITISIYFATVPYFGWKLYGIIFLLAIILTILLFWVYITLEVAPFGIQKIHADVTEYLAKQQEQQPSNDQQ